MTRPTFLLLPILTYGLGCQPASKDSASSWENDGLEDDPLTDPEEADSDTNDTAEEDCDTETDVTLYLSPDDSNSMASPVLAREAVLNDWASLGSVPIRPWEFFNYYRFAYTPPSESDIAVSAAIREDDAEAGLYTLQIGITSRTIEPEEREPMNLVFSLDVSGSMEGQPIHLLQEIALATAHSLQAGDIVSMVTWNSSRTVLLNGLRVDGPDDPTLVSAIHSIVSDGSTDLQAGLQTAYELAAENWFADGTNRVMLISDGGANTGVTDEELIGSQAGSQDQDGIYLVGVGVGTSSSYSPGLMDTVTDLGRGASLFVGDAAEAERMFGERFLETMNIAVRDVRVRLDLPPGFEIVRFSGEEYSTDPSEIEPQHLAPNDSMVFYQSLATCDPGAIVAETPLTVTVRYADARTFLDHETTLSTTFGKLLGADTSLLLKGEAVFLVTSALKAARDHDKDSTSAISEAQSALSVALSLMPEDADLLELQEIIEAL